MVGPSSGAEAPATLNDLLGGGMQGRRVCVAEVAAIRMAADPIRSRRQWHASHPGRAVTGCRAAGAPEALNAGAPRFCTALVHSFDAIAFCS